MSTGHYGKITYRKMPFVLQMQVPLGYVRISQNINFFLPSISKLLNIDV